MRKPPAGSVSGMASEAKWREWLATLSEDERRELCLHRKDQYLPDGFQPRMSKAGFIVPTNAYFPSAPNPSVGFPYPPDLLKVLDVDCRAKGK